MIDFGLVALFALQCAMVAASFFLFMRIKAEIAALSALRESTVKLEARFEALKEGVNAAVDAVTRRQGEVESAPKALLARFAEVEQNIGKSDRAIEKLDGKVASLGGRMSAIVKARKGRGDEDEESDGAAEAEGILPPGVGIPLSSQFEERPSNQVIPPGFGKPSRRVG